MSIPQNEWRWFGQSRPFHLQPVVSLSPLHDARPSGPVREVGFFVTPVTPEALEASRELATALGQARPDYADDADFIVRSRSRPGVEYAMVYNPDGYTVHQGEGCEGEPFNGVLGCWHSKGLSMSNAVVPYKDSAIERVQFSAEQVQVLKNTICRGASDAELQLFTYACQDIGLNPFLKQIWAIVRNVNIGSSQNPKYEKQLTIQVGIDGYRVIRDRIRDGNGVPLFEGMDGPQWSEDGKEWLDYPYSNTPAFARVAVWRRGIPRPYIAVCRFTAYDQNNAMWKKMGAEQLAKCAEGLALRRAFPAEMGVLPSGPVAEYEGPDLDGALAPSPASALPPAADAIEGEARDVTDERTAPEPPPAGDNPAQDTEPEQPQDWTLEAVKAEIKRLWLDAAQTWDKDAMKVLLADFQHYTPANPKFSLDALPDLDTAKRCLIDLMGRCGAPVPAELQAFAESEELASVGD